MSSFVTARPAPTLLLGQAKALLDRNRRGGYAIPSAKLYPFQWNWNSGFIAPGLAYDRPERAPHIIFHEPGPDYFPGPAVWQPAAVAAAPRGPVPSCITRPPVFAFGWSACSPPPPPRCRSGRRFWRRCFRGGSRFTATSTRVGFGPSALVRAPAVAAGSAPAELRVRPRKEIAILAGHFVPMIAFALLPPRIF